MLARIPDTTTNADRRKLKNCMHQKHSLPSSAITCLTKVADRRRLARQGWVEFCGLLANVCIGPLQPRIESDLVLETPPVLGRDIPEHLGACLDSRFIVRVGLCGRGSESK